MKCTLKQMPVYECIQIDGSIQKLEYEEGDPHEIYEWYLKHVAAGTKETHHWGDDRNYARPEMNFKYCNILFGYHIENHEGVLDDVMLEYYRKGTDKPSKTYFLHPGDYIMVVPTRGKGKKTMTVIGITEKEFNENYRVIEDSEDDV